MTDMATVTEPSKSEDEQVHVDLNSGDADERMKAHRVCHKCYPGQPMGSVALCGEKILGIRLPKWYSVFGKGHCKKCTIRAAFRHQRDVHEHRPS